MLKYGWIIKLRNPICEFAKLTVCLSHRQEISYPRDFSLSPYPKNSFTIYSAHDLAISNGLVGFPISEACTRAFKRPPLFLVSRRRQSSGSSEIAFISAQTYPCFDISVPKIFSRIIFLPSLRSVSERSAIILQSCLMFSSKKKKEAAWCYSKVAKSLYRIESLLLLLVSNMLFVPGWSIS